MMVLYLSNGIGLVFLEKFGNKLFAVFLSCPFIHVNQYFYQMTLPFFSFVIVLI